MSRRKTLPPVGEPRQGELITLKGWRERKTPKERKQRPRFLDRPPEAKREDVFEYNPLCFTLPSLGARRGDAIAVYLTSDIETGDWLSVRYDGKTYISKLLAQTAQQVEVLGSDQPSAWLDRSEIEIVGRIVGVWHKDRYIETKEPLRAVHPVATLYQFKRRA
jgi:hypothetical protein